MPMPPHDARIAPTRPFQPGPEHARLARLCGDWAGTARTWADPGRDPAEAPWDGRIEAVLGGRFVRFEYRSSMEGVPIAGVLLVGFHRDEKKWTTAWIDSFHTGTDILASSGEESPGGPIAVSGTYFAAAGQPRWGWRTELDDEVEGALDLRMYNVTPGGEESLGVEVVLVRPGPR